MILSSLSCKSEDVIEHFDGNVCGFPEGKSTKKDPTSQGKVLKERENFRREPRKLRTNKKIRQLLSTKRDVHLRPSFTCPIKKGTKSGDKREVSPHLRPVKTYPTIYQVVQ